MKLIQLILSSAVCMTFAGCASPSYYQAAGANGKYFGYADHQVDGALHRINFVANPSANLDQTYAFAIYRAAELAQSKGAPYFEVLEGPIDKNAIERFIGKTTASNTSAFDGKDLTALNTLYVDEPIIRPIRYYRTQTYIYVPVQPPPLPVQISLLIRLLNAPSLDPAKGFDVIDLLTRLAPKIIRTPAQTT